MPGQEPFRPAIRRVEVGGTHAQFDGGSVSVEAGIMEILTRMQANRFKVFEHLADWWEEFRLYHRKDGKIVKLGEDLLDATRYGVMMLREAVTTADYDPLAY